VLGLEGDDGAVPVRDPASDLEVSDSFALVSQVREVAGGHTPSVGQLDGCQKVAMCCAVDDDVGVGHTVLP
jgi:hypothetical protein